MKFGSGKRRTGFELMGRSPGPKYDLRSPKLSKGFNMYGTWAKSG